MFRIKEPGNIFSSRVGVLLSKSTQHVGLSEGSGIIGGGLNSPHEDASLRRNHYPAFPASFLVQSKGKLGVWDSGAGLSAEMGHAS